MMTYQRLKQTLEKLEKKWFYRLQHIYPQVPVQNITNGCIQTFSCENITKETRDDEEVVVICGVGINYAQGLTHQSFPRPLPHIYTRTNGATWVEDYAPAMRRVLNLNLAQYFQNPTSWVQNGYASNATILPQWPDKNKPYSYILIATNLSPFLTQKIWSYCANQKQIFACQQLLNSWNPNNHLCDLMAKLGKGIDLWVVHGKGAVWPRFKGGNSCSGFPQWLMTHNLSFPWGTRWIRSFWNRARSMSPETPQFPCCPVSAEKETLLSCGNCDE